MSAITLTAKTDEYQGSGHYVAKITGRDPKFHFAREFVSRKDGTRAEAVIDEAGLYEVRNINKKAGKQDEYVIFDGTSSVTVSLETAMSAAKNIETADWAQIVRDAQIAEHREKLASYAGKDMEAMVTIANDVGTLSRSIKHKRGAVAAERTRLLSELTGALDPRAQALAEIRRLMAAHNISAQDLS